MTERPCDPRDSGEIVSGILDWYDAHARDLPWRRDSTSAWGVMVSEFMLQQTPVARVLEPWAAWLDRWPTPAALAAAPSGDAVRAWGRLGYPRRALRLHAAATVIVEQHGGQVPRKLDQLRALPGVGEYTAAAIASFAFGQAHPVLDTNVRRVLGRVVAGVEFPAPSVNRAERELAARLLPGDGTAARWSVAVMELGALVCTANEPNCGGCPVQQQCAWLGAGRPAYQGPPRKAQAWAGTDRMVRGKLLAVVRAAPGSVTRARLDAVWEDAEQRERCVESLVADGLLVRGHDDRFALPGG